jgi:16S rRNA (cytidine1402-2'-O)-methyltransferase
MLILAAMPIGNTGDATCRLIEALRSTEIVAAEDTRRLHASASRLGIKIDGKVVSYHDHNEEERRKQLLEAIQGGTDVLLVSDAGLPLINDPGYKLVQAVIATGEQVTCLPGPSAPLTALVLSGLPTAKFCFEGFLPPKSGARLNALRSLENERRTIIFLESTHRVAKCLNDMREVFGNSRRAAVCRELTKTHEEVLRGDLQTLCELVAKRSLKGEICLVVEGAPK